MVYSSNVDGVNRAFTNWPCAYPCPVGGDILPRTINPPPPPPTIKIIAMYGREHNSTSIIAGRLATGLRDYQHFDLRNHMLKLTNLPHGDTYKKTALCNLDQYSLEEIGKQGRWPPPLLLVEMMQRYIDEQVAAGHRKFVFCGMPNQAELLWEFSHRVAEPNAIVFLEGSQPEQWHRDVAGYYIRGNDDKILSVPTVEGDVEQTYQNLLLAFAKKAHSTTKTMQPAQKVANARLQQDREKNVSTAVVAQEPRMERKDTPVQSRGGRDLLDELDYALRPSVPGP